MRTTYILLKVSKKGKEIYLGRTQDLNAAKLHLTEVGNIVDVLTSKGYNKVATVEDLIAATDFSANAIIDIAESIIAYYDRTRQVGHTTAGNTLEYKDNTIVVKNKLDLAGLRNKLKGQNKPLVLDHSVVVQILKALI